MSGNVAGTLGVPSAIRMLATAHGVCLLLLLSASKSNASEIPKPIGELIRQTCVDCHDGAAAEGGLDLTSLAFTLDDRELRDRWILIHDRVSAGEIPPEPSAMADPTGSGFRNTISLDQFAVEHLGQQTRFPTLNLGVNIDKANRSLSWTRDGVLLPTEDKPSELFRRMFVQGSPNEVQRQLQRLEERGSILDTVSHDLHGFQRNLGRDDRERLDQYFTSVRELEERLHVAGEWEQKPKPATEHELPEDILDKAKFFEKFDLMPGWRKSPSRATRRAS